MIEHEEGEDTSELPLAPPLRPQEREQLRAFLAGFGEQYKTKDLGEIDDEEVEQLYFHLAALQQSRRPLVLDRRVPARYEEKLRTTAKSLLAVCRVPQAKLAEVLEVSQSTVSHMLSDRAHGLTTTEVYWVEELCQVRRGTVYELAGYIVPPSVEELIYGEPGITEQTAEALVAAVHKIRDRRTRLTQFEHDHEEGFGQW